MCVFVSNFGLGKNLYDLGAYLCVIFSNFGLGANLFLTSPAEAVGPKIVYGNSHNTSEKSTKKLISMKNDKK